MIVMEPTMVPVKMPRTVLEPHAVTVQQPRTVMDEQSIAVPKIVLEEQEVEVPVPRAVQVPVKRMVPRTIMVPITTYVTQYVEETEKVSPCALRSVDLARSLTSSLSQHCLIFGLPLVCAVGCVSKYLFIPLVGLMLGAVMWQRTIKVPRHTTEEKRIQVPRQILEPRTVMVQRPTVMMEERLVTTHEPRVYNHGMPYTAYGPTAV
jgi:hypothetical protein